MKIIRAIAAIAFFAAITAASVAAQPKPATTPAKPGPISSGPATTGGSTTGNVPEAKVALVDTDAFLDPKVGIQRLLAAASKLESEFQPRRTDLNNMQGQVEKMTADLQKA